MRRVIKRFQTYVFSFTKKSLKFFHRRTNCEKTQRPSWEFNANYPHFNLTNYIIDTDVVLPKSLTKVLFRVIKIISKKNFHCVPTVFPQCTSIHSMSTVMTGLGKGNLANGFSE